MSTPEKFSSDDLPRPPQPLPHAHNRVIPITPSSLCSLGWRPRLLTGLLIDLMRRHFQPPNIEDSNLRQLVWQAGVQTSILIESIYRRDATTLGKRPAILVK